MSAGANDHSEQMGEPTSRPSSVPPSGGVLNERHATVRARARQKIMIIRRFRYIKSPRSFLGPGGGSNPASIKGSSGVRLERAAALGCWSRLILDRQMFRHGSQWMSGGLTVGILELARQGRHCK